MYKVTPIIRGTKRRNEPGHYETIGYQVCSVLDNPSGKPTLVPVVKGYYKIERYGEQAKDLADNHCRLMNEAMNA